MCNACRCNMTCQMTLVSNMIAIGLHRSVTWSSYLKVFATHQASVDIDGAKGHNAALLEVKVKVLQQQLPDQNLQLVNSCTCGVAHRNTWHLARYGVQVWAFCALPDFAARLGNWFCIISCSRHYRLTAVMFLKLAGAVFSVFWSFSFHLSSHREPTIAACRALGKRC